MDTYIYALIHPNNGEIRYIGKADNPELRYCSHLNTTNLRFSTRKTAWIKSLRKIGLKPELLIVDKVPLSEWAFWERLYIKLFKLYGMKLTNTTEGGEGWHTGIGHSAKSKKQISLAKIGQPLPPWTRERKLKASKAHTGKKLSDYHIACLSKAKIGKSAKRNYFNLSGLRGVTYEKTRNKWQSRITTHGKCTHLGRFATKEEAARAYDKKAIELFGIGCYLNFPINTVI